MPANSNRNQDEQIITTTCSYDCGGRCLLRVHIRDQKIAHISTENRKGLHIQACPRGLAQKSVVYHSDRLTQPLKRVGARGDGKFQPVSWDQALETIAEKIQHTISKFGTESLYFVTNTGSMATLHNTPIVTRRFFGLLGRCTTTWGNPSYEGAKQSALATFGTAATGSTRDNLLASKLIILWGWNPLVTRFGPDTIPYLSQAKKAGAHIVCVDPRQNQTCHALADEWIPVKPGTDTALLTAMAYVMISEELLDYCYVEKYTHGFDKFREYVTGETDGVPKSPEWAHAICGTPVESIVKLARSYIENKPASLIAGWAPGRTAYGEQFHRAASTLSAISGNMGIDGGHSAGGADYVDMGSFEKTLPVPKTRHHKVHLARLYDALLDSKSESKHPDCKLLYIVGCNLLNQNLNLNKGTQALKKVDFIVTHELFLTPTAKFADIVLPVKHFFEGEDIGQPFVGGPYCIYMHKVLDAPPGVKSDLDIFSKIAERMGIENDNDRSDKEWLESFIGSEPQLPDLRTLKTDGVKRFAMQRAHVAFREEIENPDKYPFPTPSGKIEIFSQRFAELDNPAIPPIPTYMPSCEGPEDPLARKYPIQLISPHSKARANSQFDNIESIKKGADDNLWMNPTDANQRNIQNGNTVHVFNKRGRMRVAVKVTHRIMPGVASIDQGQWYAPDDRGIDSGGCANILITDRRSPAGAFPCNTCLVQIEKCSD
jgi:anaerobic dimethyl sulfoxide reductase subunit A